MHIYLLRHGDASSDSRYSDNERPLTDLGVRQATLVAAFLHEKNVRPDIIFTSPLKRAQQTAAIVQSELGVSECTTSDLLVNGNNQVQLIRQLNTLTFSSVLLVGHIPHLSDTISYLVDGHDSSEIEMKKCTLALVEIPHPIQPGSGTLKQLAHLDEIVKLIKPV